MATFLTALAGAVVGAALCMLALTYLIKVQLEKADDINDAPCLVCQEHQCECGEDD